MTEKRYLIHHGRDKTGAPLYDVWEGAKLLADLLTEGDAIYLRDRKEPKKVEKMKHMNRDSVVNLGILTSELNNMLTLWQSSSRIERFGQFFINHINPRPTDPEIFYEENTENAYFKIFNRYVKMEIK